MAASCAALLPRCKISAEAFVAQCKVAEDTLRDAVRDALHDSRALSASRAKALEAQAEAETVSSEQLDACALELEVALSRGETPPAAALAAMAALAPAVAAPCVGTVVALPMGHDVNVYAPGSSRLRTEVSLSASRATGPEFYIVGKNHFARDSNVISVECRGDDGELCEGLLASDISAAAEGAVVERVEFLSPGIAIIGFTVPDCDADQPLTVRVSFFGMTSLTLDVSVKVPAQGSCVACA